MTPDRAVVKKALADADGHKGNAAALLGCSRETLYKWCGLLGLDKYAGICRDTQEQLDRRARQDTRTTEERKTVVHSAGREAPTLRLVQERAATLDEIPVTASMKLPPSLWRRVKVEAARRDMQISKMVALLLESSLQAEQRGKK